MLIILDRDGVINEDSDEYIKSPDEWIPIPGSLDAIAQLNRAGHQVVVATNQSGIARRLYDVETLNQIHSKMHEALAQVGGHIDDIFYCPHLPEEHCACRKPKPGLLMQIAEKYQTDFKNAIMIGDALRDIQCAQAMHCKAILVKTGKGIRIPADTAELQNIPVFDDLAAAVKAILDKKIVVE